MSQPSEIERRLYNRLLDVAVGYLPEGFALMLNEQDWADLEALYAERGEIIKTPVIHGVPIVRKQSTRKAAA